MRPRISVQWLARIVFGLGLAALSVQVAWIFGRSWWQVGAVCGVLAAIGVGIAAFAEWQERRARRLRRASKTVNLPASWSVKFGKATPDGWTAAIAVIRDDGMRFVVDIRHLGEVAWSATDDTTAKAGAWLVDGRGKRLRADPLPRLQKAAQSASAAPVLWLPDDDEGGVHRHLHSNVLLVTGNARDLKAALQGARHVPAKADAAPPAVLATAA